MDERLIDLLWEVKEGYTHPTKAYKEILKLIKENYVSNETHIRTIAMIKELESDKQK